MFLRGDNQRLFVGPARSSDDDLISWEKA